MRGLAGPDPFAFDVHVEVGDDDQSDHYQGGNQDSGDEGRKKVEKFLKAEKVPRRLCGIRRKQRIRKLLERGIPEKCDEHHDNNEHLKCDGLADQEMGIGHQLRAAIADHFGGSLFRDENDAARLFLRVGAEAGVDLILFHLRP